MPVNCVLLICDSLILAKKMSFKLLFRIPIKVAFQKSDFEAEKVDTKSLFPYILYTYTFRLFLTPKG